jgi:hypothetical protein
MPAKFLGFVIRAALIFAIAVSVCRTASAAPAKTADRGMNNVHCGVDPLLLNDGTVLFAGNDFNRRGDAPQTIEIYHPPPR